MRGRRLLVLAGLLVGAAAACSLNPQPLPPGANYPGDDAGTGMGVDGSVQQDGGAFGDAGWPPDEDGGVDAAGSLDAGDAAVDASDAGEDADADVDASDASDDASEDALAE